MAVRARVTDFCRKVSGVVTQRKIPYRVARRLARRPELSLFWRLTKRLYASPSAFFRRFGFFPLPVVPTSYKNFRYVDYQPVSAFPASDTPMGVHPKRWAAWTSHIPEQLRSPVISSSHTVFITDGYADAAGNVFSTEGFLVVGASHPLRANPDDYYVPTRVFPPLRRARSIAVLTSNLQGNYFHWLTETLPRLHMLRSLELRPDALFIQVQTAFQKESLALLRQAGDQIINTEDYAMVSASNLVVPFHEMKPMTECPSWVCSFLRNAFLPLVCQEDAPKTPKRLYLSRQSASCRQVLNEDEVMRLLEPLGFRRIELAEMPFLEQVRSFARAEAIVAPHGSGLANLVFAKPGTKVVEFQPVKLQDMFFRLARRLELDYYCVQSLTGPLSPHNNRQFISVDLDELDQMLRLASIR